MDSVAHALHELHKQQNHCPSPLREEQWLAYKVPTPIRYTERNGTWQTLHYSIRRREV